MSKTGLLFLALWTVFAASAPWAMQRDRFKLWWTGFCVLTAASIAAIFEVAP